MSFKLLELPDVPLLKTISLVDIQALFFLSTLSKKMRRIIKSANIPLRSTRLEVNDDRPYLGISKEDDNSAIYLRPLSYEIHFHPFFPLPMFREFLVNGVLLKCYANTNDWFFSETEANPEQGMLERTFAYFFGFLKMSLFQIGTNQTPISSVFFWKYSKNVISLRTRQESAPLTQDDVNFMYKDLTVGIMELEAPVAPNVEYNDAFTSRITVIWNPTWINFDSVLNSTSSMIIFLQCSIPRTSQEINYLIKHWLTGGLQNLTVFQVVLDEEPVVNVYSTDAYREECIAGVDVNEFDERLRPRAYDVDYSIGQDVYRTDGRVATIKFDARKLYFFVWPVECITR